MRPGSFGATVYNELFSRHGIDAVYLPRPAPSGGKELMDSLRTLGVSGCSVSMPLKTAILPFLDTMDPLVETTRSCNTVVARGGRMLGFNTDVTGFKEALRSENISPNRILIYGYGSVVSSVVAALRSNGKPEIQIMGRRAGAARERAEELGVELMQEGIEGKFDLLVNATPASQDAALAGKVFPPLLRRSEAVIDLAVSPDPIPLSRIASDSGKKFIAGIEMAKRQLLEQFYHYTAIRPDLAEIEDIIRNSYRT
jgi:shikimate dehydrogenase